MRFNCMLLHTSKKVIKLLYFLGGFGLITDQQCLDVCLEHTYSHAATYIYMYSIIRSIQQNACPKLTATQFPFLMHTLISTLSWTILITKSKILLLLSLLLWLPTTQISILIEMYAKKKKIDHTVSAPEHRWPPWADTGKHHSAVTSCLHHTTPCINSEVKFKFKDWIVYTLGNL